MGSKRLRLAVVLGSGMESGGGFQYEHRTLSILKRIGENSEFDIKCYSTNRSIISDHESLGLDISYLKDTKWSKFHRLALSNLFGFKLFNMLHLNVSNFERQFVKDGIDLVYFLYPNPLACCLVNLPYIFTLWDLGHLDLPEFPEIANNGQFLIREDMYTKCLSKAFRVTVDSQYGKDRVIRKYSLDKNRVEVLRFLPSLIETPNYNVDIRKKYNIVEPYIYYPAQFWPHKNHVYILRAIEALKTKFSLNISAVFTGSDKGNLEHVLEQAKKLGLEDNIYNLGFVPQEDIPNLYKQSLSLVMPSYLGPTNIPPLEAIQYGVPVCYSDKESFREQMGKSALYMDLDNPISLAKHLKNIISGDYNHDEMQMYGREVLSRWDDRDFENTLSLMLRAFLTARSCWK